MLPKAARVIQKYLEAYETIGGPVMVTVGKQWDPHRTKRTRVIVPIVLEHVEGDILEIGAHIGTTTVVFCDAARDKGRNVTVIDPWDGRQQGNNKIHQQFKTATTHLTNLVVHHMGSEDPRPLAQFKADGTKFAFILIDGLHSYPAVKNDIEKYSELLMPGGILCIDDWHGPYTFSKAIQKAANECLGDNWRQLSHPESLIETYFVKLA